jgi:hypothetical protein
MMTNKQKFEVGDLFRGRITGSLYMIVGINSRKVRLFGVDEDHIWTQTLKGFSADCRASSWGYEKVC